MRPPLVRLIGLAAASSLILGSLAAAGPANAVDDGDGVISVKLVDDLGEPVNGLVVLLPDEDDAPIVLGMPEVDDDDDYVPPTAAAAFTEEIPAGTYGAVALGGWAGVTCVGLRTCSATDALTATVETVPLGPGAFEVTEGGTTPLTVTIATPKLSGTPDIGQPLTMSTPSMLSELSTVLMVVGGGDFGDLPTEPSIMWNRNGAATGMTGKTYVPTSADAGATISATVSFPVFLTLYLSAIWPGVVPRPFTSASVAIPALPIPPAPVPPAPIERVTPSIKLSVPKKFKAGKRPKAYVNVSHAGAAVRGVVTIAVGKARPQQAALRAGLATFQLPKLKPGRYKVKVSVTAIGAYHPASVTKTVVVKAKKPKKGKGKKK